MPQRMRNEPARLPRAAAACGPQRSLPKGVRGGNVQTGRSNLRQPFIIAIQRFAGLPGTWGYPEVDHAEMGGRCTYLR